MKNYLSFKAYFILFFIPLTTLKSLPAYSGLEDQPVPSSNSKLSDKRSRKHSLDNLEFTLHELLKLHESSTDIKKTTQHSYLSIPKKQSLDQLYRTILKEVKLLRQLRRNLSLSSRENSKESSEDSEENSQEHFERTRKLNLELSQIKKQVGIQLINESLCHAARLTHAVIFARASNDSSYEKLADGADAKPLHIKANSIDVGIFGGLIPCDLKSLTHHEYSSFQIRLQERRVNESLRNGFAECKPLTRYVGRKRTQTAVIRESKELFVFTPRRSDSVPKVLYLANRDIPLTSDLDLYLIAVPSSTKQNHSPLKFISRETPRDGFISPFEKDVISNANSYFNQLFHNVRDQLLGLDGQTERTLIEHGPENHNPNPSLIVSFPIKKVSAHQGDCTITQIGSADHYTDGVENLKKELEDLKSNGFHFTWPEYLK